MNRTKLWKLVENQRQDLIAFAQKLVQTPSLSGQEGDVAALIRAEMERLGYDRVWVDKTGNVIGQINGGDGPSTMLNGHMDHVETGDPDLWPHPPMGGEIHDGKLWGRGSVDMKGALAAMVHAGGVVKQLGQPLPGAMYVCGVVQEEIGGLGSRHLAATLPVDRVIIGEASGNQLRRGHRGRIELNAHWYGRSVHASMPDLGVNPHHSLARFMTALPGLDMAADPDYGVSTVAPTRVASEPDGANIIPEAIHLVLDWRNIPGEGSAEVVAKLQELQERTLAPGCRGMVEMATKRLTAYTGASLEYPYETPSFTTDARTPWLLAARDTLSAVLDRSVEVSTWRFATDGGFFAVAGAQVIGIGPGDAEIVHTAEERLSIDQLVESAGAYAALCLMSS